MASVTALAVETPQDPDAPPARAPSPLLIGPILPTLARLAAPNTLAMSSATLVSIAETTYVGRLGVPSLAGLTLVFPLIMMMQMMSGGAMSGGIASAVARALGADDDEATAALPLCAFMIGLVGAVVFSSAMLAFGPSLYALLGGRGAALGQAIAYSNVAAFGIFLTWINNTSTGVMRGAGRMTAPAVVGLLAGVLQIAVGGVFGLGLLGAPRLGITGVALGMFASVTVATILTLTLMRQPAARVRLTFRPRYLQARYFADILKVGGMAVLSPLQSVTTVMILTRVVAPFGVAAIAGYGVGARLEFLLISVSFAVGVASLPMVGVAVGAGETARARRVAWTASAVAGVTLGLIGAVLFAFPDLWARLFIHDPAALAAAHQYLRAAAFGYPFLGAGLSLYFSAQGAGRVGGPILAQTLRLTVIAVGGWLLARAGAPLPALFALIALSMAALGLGAITAVKLTPWGVRAGRGKVGTAFPPATRSNS
jgi:Na+-driven multidrug efflux pump